jgi:hypothetical protein
MLPVPQNANTYQSSLTLIGYTELVNRYESQGLAKRAEMILVDALPAMEMAEYIFGQLEQCDKLDQSFINIRKNHALIDKVRGSNARNALIDTSSNFIDITRQTMAKWTNTLQRIAGGEGIIRINGCECLDETSPLALAIAGYGQISNYLAMTQLILNELMIIDTQNNQTYTALVAKTRRCSTVLSDYENMLSIIKKAH